MKNPIKYLLTLIVTVVVSLTIAAATASAQCHLEISDEYTCYVTGQDANYCYYDCYCKVSSSACDAALRRDGFEILN